MDETFTYTELLRVHAALRQDLDDRYDTLSLYAFPAERETSDYDRDVRVLRYELDEITKAEQIAAKVHRLAVAR